jgi:hypothetical protein
MATSNISINQHCRMQFQGLFDKVIEVEFLWNPPNVLSNATSEESITVEDAQLGDICLLSMDADHQGTVLDAYVPSANIVDLIITNGSGGSVNLAEGHAHLILLRPHHRHG